MASPWIESLARAENALAENERLRAEIEQLRAIIKKQMSPTEISQQLAECNELADAYAEQNVTVKELRAEVERLRAELAAERKRCGQVILEYVAAAAAIRKGE